MTNTDILLEDLEDVLDDATSMPMTKRVLLMWTRSKPSSRISALIPRRKQSRQRQ